MEDLSLLLLEQAPALIWRAQPDSICDWFNQTWLAFTGRTMEQEGNNGWVEGVHADDVAGCMHTYLEAFGARRRFEMEYRLKRHDGEYRWILDHGLPFQQDGRFGGYVGYCFDITDRKIAEEKLTSRTMELETINRELLTARHALERIANYDQLTGLSNRHHFAARFAIESKRRTRTGSPLSILLLDLDHFKRVNDTYGHTAGDECLRSVAAALRDVVRETDIVGRYGGEEFIVLLPDTELSGAAEVATKICESVRTIRCVADGSEIELTVSVGGVSMRPGGSSNLDELVQGADRELYKAKSEGRNRAIVAIA